MAVGRWIFSRAASSDGVSGPWQEIVASAAPWVGLRAPPRPAGACAARAGRSPGAGDGRGRWWRSFASLISLANDLGACQDHARCRPSHAPAAVIAVPNVSEGRDQATHRRDRARLRARPDPPLVRPGPSPRRVHAHRASRASLHRRSSEGAKEAIARMDLDAPRRHPPARGRPRRRADRLPRRPSSAAPPAPRRSCSRTSSAGSASPSTSTASSPAVARERSCARPRGLDDQRPDFGPPHPPDGRRHARRRPTAADRVQRRDRRDRWRPRSRSRATCAARSTCARSACSSARTVQVSHEHRGPHARHRRRSGRGGPRATRA